MDAIDRIRKKMGISAERKYTFFLNDHPDFAFSNCPQCPAKTKIRKFALVIHIDPKQLFVLNKKCRLCTNCELIIAKKNEVEDMMAQTFETRKPEIIGNDYLIIGTVNKGTWRLIKNKNIIQEKAIK